MSKSKQGLYQNHPSVNRIDWRWKRWDVRADGKVFWQYGRYGEIWLDWDKAIATRDSMYRSNRKQKLKNPEYHRKLNAEWREKNRVKHCENSRVWGKRNRERCNARRRERDKKRKQLDPIYVMRTRLRARMRNALKDGGFKKAKATYEILGADYATAAAHLESQFKDGMSWANRSEWHIDHIIPLASAKNEEELLKLCHYTNLQPLWAMDNLKKGALL